MITIIHGDDTASSRNYLIEQKQKLDNASTFEGEKLSINVLMQIFEGGGLFANDKNLIIEKFFPSKASGKSTEELAEYLKKQSKNGNIFIWEEKELTKKHFSVFPSAEIKTFKLPKELFLFLDSIKPSQSTNLIKLFHKILSQSETELVFFMMIRQIRLLLALHPCHPELVSGSRAKRDSDLRQNDNNNIDEVKRLAPWQLSKLKRQSECFTTEQLVSLYKRLYDIDLAQKTGANTLSLDKTIDFLLLDI